MTQSLSVGSSLALGACASVPESIETGDFTHKLSGTEWDGWEERHFPTKKQTQYELAQDEMGVHAIRAIAKGSASMLRKRMDIAPERLGHVNFSWKAEQISMDADIAEVDATDAVVRVLLAFDGDRSKWSSRDSMLNELSRLLMGEDMPYATLVYAWCTLGVRDSVVINPRTPTVRNLLLEAGAHKLGYWLDYRRDIKSDFEHLFGEPPGRLTSIAVMTDSDNTNSHAVGWYRGINLELV